MKYFGRDLCSDLTTTLTAVFIDPKHNMCDVEDCGRGATNVAWTAPARYQVNMCPEHARQCLVNEGCRVELTCDPKERK